MAVRHIALAVTAVLVMGACLYLFMEVRASPAAPQARAPSHDTGAAPEGDDEPEDAPQVSKREGYKPRTDGGGIRGLSRRVNSEGAARSDDSPAAAPALATSDEPAAEKLEGPKLDAVMAEANKAYDKQDFDEARSIAQKVLKQHPTNVRMLRIMTSAHCIESDSAEAQKYFNLLPGPDREQMKTRCARYGVTFTEPPVK